MLSSCKLVGTCGLGDVVSDENAVIAVNKVKRENFANGLIAAIRAYGYTPSVETTQSDPTAAGYLGWTDYVIGIAEFPDAGKVYVGSFQWDRDPQVVAQELISNAKFTYHEPAGPSESPYNPAVVPAPPATAGVLPTRDRALANQVVATVTTKPAVESATATSVTGDTAAVAASGMLSSIPTWAWLAGGGAALFFMFKGSK
jgi:hypothetical protein